MPILTNQASRFLGGGKRWYTAGGAPTPLIAYQPKDAASLEASYTNLVAPGSYDATTAAAPTLAAGGWLLGGEGSGGAIITATIAIAFANLTILVRGTPTAAGGNNLGRFVECDSVLLMIPWRGDVDAHTFRNNGIQFEVAPRLTADVVMAIAGAAAYVNGVDDGLNLAPSPDSTSAIVIGNRAARDRTLAGTIAAIAIYNSTLTPAQVAAVSAAMAAL